jgi:hypothetical protein
MLTRKLVRHGLTTGQYGRDKIVWHDKPTSRKNREKWGTRLYKLGSHQGHPRLLANRGQTGEHGSKAARPNKDLFSGHR